jgi:hypothetical protein
MSNSNQMNSFQSSQRANRGYGQPSTRKPLASASTSMNTTIQREISINPNTLETSSGRPVLISNVPSSFPTPARLTSSKSSFTSQSRGSSSSKTGSTLAGTIGSTYESGPVPHFFNNSKGALARPRVAASLDQFCDLGRPMEHKFPYSTESSFCLRSSALGSLDHQSIHTGSRVKVINHVGGRPPVTVGGTMQSSRPSENIEAATTHRPHRKLEPKSKPMVTLSNRRSDINLPRTPKVETPRWIQGVMVRDAGKSLSYVQPFYNIGKVV